MLEEGISAITSVMSFLTSSDVFKTLLGVAIAGVVISIAMGFFFKK